MNLYVEPNHHFSFDFCEIASDKSISHRCAIFSLLSNKPSFVKNYLQGEDTKHSLAIAMALGLQVKEQQGGLLLIPPSQIQEPKGILDCGNAGTAMRLYMGLLSAQKGVFVLSGDQYLNKRPMKRVIAPLQSIGAHIIGREDHAYAPITLIGSRLEAFSYQSPIPSAQVKSAMILAALHAPSACLYQEPELSRDHTEKMLEGMGAEIASQSFENGSVELLINPLKEPLKPLEIEIPCDPSSAFFFALALAIVPNSCGVLRNVLLNPTRIEAFRILEKMGVKIYYQQKSSLYEKIGDIEIISPNELRAIHLSQKISWLIDELPALSIAMAVAKGRSEVRNAKELRVKETDRIQAIVKNLRLCGIVCEEFEDGFAIEGGSIKKARIQSYGDHRIAMSFAIAGLKEGMEIEDSDCISVSFPGFVELLAQITKVSEDG